MLYLEDITAFEFWTSLARARFDVTRLGRFSALEGCPRTARESAAVSFRSIPCTFTKLALAVPDASLRVQRSRFSYHVWTGAVPENSFYRICADVCVASPALALAQASKRLSVPHLAQAVCEMLGSYVRVREGGMVDKLQPTVTKTEIVETVEALHGVRDCSRLETALPFTRDGSASPKETEMLLLLAMGKRRGGAGLPDWKMNVPIPVPSKFRRFLQKSVVRPDLLNEEKRTIVEYDSGEDHDDFGRAIEDRKRAKVLRAMGYEVISVHPEDVRDAIVFEDLVRQVKAALGVAYRRTSAEGMAARQRLMDELRTMPEIGYV